MKTSEKHIEYSLWTGLVLLTRPHVEGQAEYGKVCRCHPLLLVDE